MTLISTFIAATDEGWHGPGWWIIFVPLAWFAIFFLFFGVFRRGVWGGPGCGPRRFAGSHDVLDRRFAEGELTADEYRERRGVLDENRRGR
jgi:putative membrane protein